MKKFLIPLFILVGVVISLFVARQQIGDVRPAFFPAPATNTPQSTSPSTSKTTVSSPVDFLRVPEGFTIGFFAQGIDGARDLAFSQDGTLLVSQPGKGIIVALPDKNNDGKADETKIALASLDNPHGIAFFNNKLYVAEETRVVRYNWDQANFSASLDRVLFSLPKGDRHTTRTIAFNKEGKMFVSIGSTCDVCIEKHEWIAAVITSDANGNNPRLFAKGLRNAVFITINPQTNELWGTEMGRDFLGDNLPPDEINIIQDEKDYGWPNCYGNKIPDTQFNNLLNKGTACADTIPPAYKIPAHSAPLGLAFIQSEQFPKDWQGDLLVAYHGSWNSSVPVGYKVVKMKINGNKILGEEDFITGFINGSQAIARPVDVIFEKDGSLFLSDDKAGNIYKVIKQ